MLSRDHVIDVNRGEGTHGAARRNRPPAAKDLLASARAWQRLVLLVVVVALLAAFVFLNRGAVVEPRVHLVVFQSQRPALLAVLLLTACAGGVVALLARSALHAMNHRPDMRIGAHLTSPEPAAPLAGAASSA